MFDPRSNVARQLAEALKHHRRNLATRESAGAAHQGTGPSVDMLERMVARLQEMLARQEADKAEADDAD